MLVISVHDVSLCLCRARKAVRKTVFLLVSRQMVFFFSCGSVLFGAVWTGTVCLQACAQSVVRLLDSLPTCLLDWTAHTVMSAHSQ